MNILTEFIKFIFYSILIVAISKYLLVYLLRKFAEVLNLKPKTVGDIAGIATSTPELLTTSAAALSRTYKYKYIQYIKLEYNKFNTIYIGNIFKQKPKKIKKQSNYN